jgi:hypothetical protein
MSGGQRWARAPYLLWRAMGGSTSCIESPALYHEGVVVSIWAARQSGGVRILRRAVGGHPTASTVRPPS